MRKNMDNQKQHSSSSSNKFWSKVKDKRPIIKGEVRVVRNHGQPCGSAKSSSILILSATTIDPKTGNGKLSEQGYLRCGKTSFHNGEKITRHRIEFRVEPDFGTPGAILVKNQRSRRFFLRSSSLKTPNNEVVEFDCNSWVYPVKDTGTDRIFFHNTKYLPNQTPKALAELRKNELVSLRGNGRGERKEWDRVYDYDFYNDLGDSDNSFTRLVLGGSESYPYPRRFRTGRAPNNIDPSTESSPDMNDLDMSVPPDERLGSKKMLEVMSTSVQAAVFFLHEAQSMLQSESNDFNSLDEIHYKYSGDKKELKVEGRLGKKLRSLLPGWVFRETADMKQNPFKFPPPKIIEENEWAWKSDEEFARQMLAGTNPARIRSLEAFPPESENGFVSIIKKSDIEHNLDGMSLAQAMNQWKIFILDHHDYLMPFLETINSGDICAYASQTLLFLKSDNTMKPIAIELSFPIDLPDFLEEQEISRVFVPATKGEAGALWQYAKAHVAANDSVHHQLNSHWLQTHAAVEPFIIATRRQLSVMHPVHWLLHPHFKDTLHINAFARTILINSGGIFEKTLLSAEVSMELSAEFYREWRFDEQALPVDLLKRGMAREDEDPNNPTGVELVFQDYPYGVDGLEIWTAIKTWVTDFCTLFYADDESVASDKEIQAWWSEIRNVGHGDKSDETWWYELTTLSNLIEALTTLVWISSALHASVNFGQYDYYGYPLNRPTHCRRFVPFEGTFPFAEFLKDPDEYYLKMLPGRLETSLAVALVAVLSHHTSDEAYLGQRHSSASIANKEVQQSFDKFNEELREIEKRIAERNANPNLKNRKGPSGIPYQLLYPDTSRVESEGGITRKGIPNSVSI